LTSTVTEQVGQLGRGGVVIAMSSGLVATMGLPAQAAGRNTSGDAIAPATAPIAVQPALGFSSGPIAAGTDVSSAPLTAPATATVSFESGAFKAVPRKIVKKVRAATVNRSTSGRQTAPAPSGGGFGSAKGTSVMAIAARYLGVPYRYGGTSTSGWDCSGALQYIYAQVGVRLPRTSNDQMLSGRRVSRSEAQPGDLVAFLSGGRTYHIGAYAGGNMMYDAGRTGRVFSKREIFSSNVVFVRVL
jgi:cell wall-associated NlpC family hydrolase